MCLFRLNKHSQTKKNKVMNTTRNPRPITLKIVGYLDFITGKVYKTKAALKAAQTRVQNKVQHTVKQSREKAKEMLVSIMQGQALADRLRTAKRLLSAKWTFERQREYLSAAREYGKHLEGFLKIA